MSQNKETENVPYGGYLLDASPISFNTEKPVTKVRVKNTGDRPVQVGSHFHFFEVNKELEFDRESALGKRLNITATTAIRFEPGDEIEIELIPYSGDNDIFGFNNLVDMTGKQLAEVINDPIKLKALIDNARQAGFKMSNNPS
ncbi:MULTISPECIES: urease subunit beta [Citrobacter]|jgi:urease subunit beta|uniref:Urease subunit beta n=1 Tax=Citrobacter meridianamericanus TaxID=2894201 RepID=A0ABT1B588_9ENTR|nr:MULTISPECIES: urease subunit beta [Citrobacter]MBC6500143.1 urease subunit beta [Citrobacter freundii]MBC6557319.1 urease subunit beta [Citrobacter braakii]MBC6505009.1 urease subunit beta [Citrobacter freundii]MBP8541233.1 urease subunit beta [Citrobacter sp. On2M]MBW5271799.1 urease subunit beta [Citrobacter sp. On28M]